MSSNGGEHRVENALEALVAQLKREQTAACCALRRGNELQRAANRTRERLEWSSSRIVFHNSYTCEYFNTKQVALLLRRVFRDIQYRIQFRYQHSRNSPFMEFVKIISEAIVMAGHEIAPHIQDKSNQKTLREDAPEDSANGKLEDTWRRRVGGQNRDDTSNNTRRVFHLSQMETPRRRRQVYSKRARLRRALWRRESLRSSYSCERPAKGTWTVQHHKRYRHRCRQTGALTAALSFRVTSDWWGDEAEEKPARGPSV